MTNAAPTPVESLQRISTVTAQGFASPEEAIAAILELASELLDIETVVVSCIAEDIWRIAHVADRRFGSERGGEVPLQESHCSLVMASTTPVVINDTGAPDVRERFPLPAALGVRTYIGVPLILRDRSVYGTLCAMDDRLRAFGENEIALLQVLARLIVHELEHELRLTAVRDAGKAAIQRNEARFRSLVQHTWEVMIVLDAAGGIRDESPGVARVLGYAPGLLLGTSALDLIHTDDLVTVRRQFAALLRRSGNAVSSSSFRVRHQNGSWLWLEAMGTNLLADPAVGGIVINARDVTERQDLEAQLAHDATHDPLTGLPNRVLFLEQLATALAGERAGDGATAVLFLDLDRFKIINDSLGHAAGDMLLVAVGQQLRGALRPRDLISRFGGDELAVLLDGPVSLQQAVYVADRLIAALHRPFGVAGQEVFTSASIGVALGMAGRDRPQDLLRAADIALYRAKEVGGSTAVVFAASMDIEATARLTLETELRRALERDELRLHYQPVVGIADERPRELEALVRWAHPRHGLLLPAEFIPLAEETGLIVPLGRWVLREACRQLAAWRAAEMISDELTVAVNVSARQLRDHTLVDDVTRAVKEAELDPACLTLEVTESDAMVDEAATRATLQMLKVAGVQLALDDFGSGYSNLSALKRYPIDTLKIDQSLVARLADAPDDAAIVEAVVAVARALGLGVTAEGVETTEQACRLRAIGCDRGQGYLFAAPLPPAELEAFLVVHSS